jgi:hypothetical protein
MPTTEEQIETINKVTAEIAKIDCVNDAEINDWGRFGNFDLHVYPKMDLLSEYGLFRLSNKMRFPSVLKQIRLVLKKYPEIKFREHHLPDRKDVYDSNIQKNVSGLVRNYMSLDLDFMDYDETTNTFK